MNRPWGGRNHCGGPRAAAEPVANSVILAIEPQSTIVSRLRRSFDAQPQAKRFVVHGEEHPYFEQVVADSAAYPASVYAIPMSDTCKEVVDGVVRATIPRETLVVLRGPWILTRQALADALGIVGGREAEIPDLIAFCEVAGVRLRVLPVR